VVSARVQAWRTHLIRSHRPLEWRNAAELSRDDSDAGARLTLDEQLKIALEEFPQPRESIARTLFETTLRIGARGLLTVGAPFDKVLALGAARVAARCSRGQVRVDSIPREGCLQAVGIVQEWSAISGTNPFLVGFDGFDGRGGTLEERVTALALDVRACIALAEQLPGGPTADGFDAWEAAEEFHAYALLSVRPSFLFLMDFEKAQSFASAAARLAQAAIDGEGPQLPEFPEYFYDFPSPRTVLASTRIALPNGADQRRSVAAGSG
jgi:hypothetical protein